MQCNSRAGFQRKAVSAQKKTQVASLFYYAVNCWLRVQGEKLRKRRLRSRDPCKRTESMQTPRRRWLVPISSNHRVVPKV